MQTMRPPRDKIITATALLLSACAPSTSPETGPADSATAEAALDAPPADTASSACAVYVGFSRLTGTDCGACVTPGCAAELAGLRAVQTQCAEQLRAADACTACPCVANALSSPACASAFEAFLGCVVSRCAPACR
jgi:hypothetical protein